jgi:hypothetical protein
MSCYAEKRSLEVDRALRIQLVTNGYGRMLSYADFVVSHRAGSWRICRWIRRTGTTEHPARAFCFRESFAVDSVGWPKIGELGEQIAVGPHPVRRHLAICDNGEEVIENVVGKCPAIVRI